MIKMTIFLMIVFCGGGLLSKLDFNREPRRINDEKAMNKYRKLFNYK